MNQTPGKYSDEIELIDYFIVAWKWRFFILTGTIICTLVVGIVSILMTKIYSVNMVIQPGVLKFASFGTDDAKTVYIENATTFKSIIESGVFDEDLLHYISTLNKNTLLRKVKIKASIPENTNLVMVSYETNDIEFGIKILNHLAALLNKKYENRVNGIKNKIENQMKLNQEVLKDIESKKLAIRNSFQLIDERIDELLSQAIIRRKNLEKLIQTENDLSIQTDSSNFLHRLFYNNTIQHNYEIINVYKDQISELKFLREEKIKRLQEVEVESLESLKEMKEYEFLKTNLKPVEVIQSPTPDTDPVRPKPMVYTSIAAASGFFLMLIIAFFREYLHSYRNRTIKE